MKHKKLFITFTAIFTVILSLVIFLMIWFWGDSYKSSADYEGFETFRSEFDIPGLKDGACPQGLASYRTTYTVKDEDGNPKLDADGKEQTLTQDYFFISAYFDNQPSRVYVIGKETGLIGYVTFKNLDGTSYNGHCGGVATNGYTFWLVSGKTVYVARKDNSTSANNIARDIIAAAENNGEVEFTAEFKANCNAAFCYFYDSDGNTTNMSSSDRLYVGEFYREKNYKTDPLHHVTTTNGEENRAFVYEYNISTSSTNKYGLALITDDKVAEENRVPKIQNIYSITDEIQGFARTRSGGLVLSQSYGLKNSRLYYYDWSELSKSEHRIRYSELTYTQKNEKGEDEEVKYGNLAYEGVLTTNGAQYKDVSNIYVYYIDSSSLINTYSIPAMSEGLCLVDDRVYVLFESGAKKYRKYVRQIVDEVYSFIPRTKR